MSKEEIALELTKLSYVHSQHENKLHSAGKNPEEVVTELYNYIFSNLLDSEHNK